MQAENLPEHDPLSCTSIMVGKKASATFAYLDTAYPCMNEKKLAMGETTITGRKELVKSNGMFMIEELHKNLPDAGNI